MATRLNQILAVEKGVKASSARDITDAYHSAQKIAPMTGIERRYKPRDDEGEQLPAESTKVQFTALDQLKAAQNALGKLFDITATKDVANTHANADVVVDGKPLLSAVPVTYLLFLEKQLTDLHTIVKKLPVLDPSENWQVHDAVAGIYRTDPVTTTRTKKVPRNHVKAVATANHPAQVELYYEDVVVGYWEKTGYSGALPAARVTALLGRVEKLQEAVKFAREAANNTEVVDTRVADKVFGYLFG